MATKVKKSILYIALILLALTCILPFILMIVNATRSGREIMTFFTFIPSTHLVENWQAVSKYINLFKGFGNSLMISIPATLLTLDNL